MVFGLLATLCAGTFFGAALYISLAQHPAALEAGGSVPATFFPPMYRRAAPMQIALALIGTIAGILEWYFNGGILWLVGAVALASVIPITLLFLKPINDVLLAPDNDPTSEETWVLLRRWGYRHWIRSLVSGAAFMLYLFSLVATPVVA